MPSMRNLLPIILGLLFIGCDSTDAVYQGSPFEVLETGAWDSTKNESFCQSRSHSFKFSKDRSRMILNFFDSGSSLVQSHEYIIEGSETGMLHTSLIGESRKDDRGKPVKWKLIVNNENQYCWRRSDWGDSGCTAAFKRCM